MRLVALLAVVLITATVVGCTKLTPASVDDFGAEKSLLVTLRDGDTIKGHLDVDEWVTFTTFGRVYRAKVEDITDNGDITLHNPYVVEEYEQFQLQRERMSKSVLHISDGTEQIQIPAYKIVKVEESSIDRMKTARASIFWAYTVLVAGLIFNAQL
jgi:hypothetical protein